MAGGYKSAGNEDAANTWSLVGIILYVIFAVVGVRAIIKDNERRARRDGNNKELD